MKPIIIEDNLLEFEPFEEDSILLLAEDTPWRGFAVELQELHYLKGAQFINQLKQIVNSGEFHPIDGETNIFSAIGEDSSGNKILSVSRRFVEGNYYIKMFMKRFLK